MNTDEKLQKVLKRYSPGAIRQRERGWARNIEEKGIQGRALISQFVLSEMAGLLLFEVLLMGLPVEEKACLREKVSRAIGDHVPCELCRNAFLKLNEFVNL